MKLFISIIFSLFCCFSLFSQQIHANDMESKQITLVAKILQNSSSERMQNVWPDFDMRTRPVFITFKNGHIYAFNIKMKEGEWKKISFQGMEALYTDKDLWGITTTPMQFDFEIEGQKAFVYQLDMMDGPAFLPFFVMVHERFHVYQMQYFESEKESFGNSYPESDNPENLTLMTIEEQILLDFMKSLSKNDHQAAYTYLKMFISVNQERRKFLSPSSIRWEARQQTVEGLADYAGAKNLDVFGYFGKNVGLRHVLKTMDGYTHDDDVTARALKWRHYGVGSSIAYALDFLKVKGWKNDVEEHNISLQTILEENLHLEPSEIQAYYQQALQQYDYAHLYQKIDQKNQAYKNMLNQCEIKFHQMPGVTMSIQSPPHSGLSAGGRSRGIYTLADGSVLSVEDTADISSTDNRWNLELKSVPYLFQTNDGYRKFKENSDRLEIIVDGKHCPLDSVKVKEFTQLSIQGEMCNFKSSDNPGWISWEGGELKVTFIKTAAE